MMKALIAVVFLLAICQLGNFDLGVRKFTMLS